MSSFRSKTSDAKEEWSHRLGLLRRGGKRRTVDSCVAGSASSFVGEPPTRQRRFGLRQLASDSHLREQYSSSRSLTSSTSSAHRDRAPSLVSESPSYSSSTMAGMLDMEPTRFRRDRTFVGNHCAVCEEPLEHTLQGERVLQFSCGHVSHEACFYEYIKEVDAQYCPECNSPLGLDSSRGGNVLDLGATSLHYCRRYMLTKCSREIE